MSLARNVAIVGGITLVSRLLGFVRDMMIAAVFGAGVRADAFFVAFQFASLIRKLLAEGAMNSAVVPLYLRARDEGGEAAAARYAGQLIGTLSVVLAGLTVLLALAMPLVIVVLAPGFAFDDPRLPIAVELARLMLPFLALSGPLAILMGVLNANHRFANAALVAVVFNVVMLLAIGAVFWLQSGDSVLSARIVAISVALAGLAQLMLVGIGVWLGPARVTPLGVSFGAPVRRFLALAVPGLVASGIPQITIIAATMVASASPSAVSWLYYANRLIELPVGIVGIAIGTVLVPAFTHALRGGDQAELAAAESRGLEIAMLLALPAAALSALALGIPGHVLTKALSSAFFAREDTATPMRAAFAGFAVALIGSLVLLPGFGHVGVALATGLSGWVSAVVLGGIIARRIGFSLDQNARRRLPRIAIASAVMGVAIAALQMALGPWLGGPSVLLRLAALSALIGAGLAVYAALLHLLRVAQLRDLLKALRPPA